MDIIKTYFNENGWQFTQSNSKNTFFLGFTGKNGGFQTLLEVTEGKSFTFFSIYGNSAPIEKQPEILTLINLINNDRFLGNFEMNPETGEIRYKTCLSLIHVKLTKDILDEIILSNLVTMDRFIPAIKSVLFDDKTAGVAYLSHIKK